MDEVTGSLVFLHLVRQVVDGVDDVGGLSVGVELGDGVSMEIQPVRLFVGALVPAFVQLELALATLHQTEHLLRELLALIRMDALCELLEGESAFREDVAIAVGHPIVGDVVLHDVEVAHVERLVHHLVQFR